MPPSSAFIPTFSYHILTIFSHLVHSHVRLQSLNSERYPTAGTYIDSEFWVVETAVQTVKESSLESLSKCIQLWGIESEECSQWNHKRTCSFPRGLSRSSRYSHPSYVVAWRRRGRTFLCRWTDHAIQRKTHRCVKGQGQDQWFSLVTILFSRGYLETFFISKAWGVNFSVPNYYGGWAVCAFFCVKCLFCLLLIFYCYFVFSNGFCQRFCQTSYKSQNSAPTTKNYLTLNGMDVEGEKPYARQKHMPLQAGHGESSQEGAAGRGTPPPDHSQDILRL